MVKKVGFDSNSPPSKNVNDFSALTFLKLFNFGAIGMD
jgi:hypothetical protein